MGIDFYTCVICKSNFPDCGDYSECEECENMFCGRKCANLKPLELNEDKYNCCICRKEEADDSILLYALLRHYNITRDDAMKIWKGEK